jgi:hypothetical protein
VHNWYEDEQATVLDIIEIRELGLQVPLVIYIKLGEMSTNAYLIFFPST